MEAMSCILKRALQGGYLDKEHVEVLSWAFTWFEAMFGLKINLHKSELIPMGVVPNFEELARVLGYKWMRDFGNGHFVERTGNMEKKWEIGVLVLQGKVAELGFGRRLAMGGWMEFSKRVAFKVGNGRRVRF
ncbi:hypothetical protein CK203_116500 [Vitis vinifera]|uniref:Reverse transcriptase domain-containing protein n=1 Tax=Vitis vinifera TaxID=29760 RepID=A0A438CA14_VITVI|nr:hypothetical protein CK203_116500 [Vitis vinifera]